MTNAEMNRRLATMTPALIEQVKHMVDQGYGEIGIANNSMATRKQANAVFQLVQGDHTKKAKAMVWNGVK